MIAGIVLAAGRSRRMGEPKPFLRLGGLTFLERAVHALRDGGCDVVWVVAAAGDERVAEAARALGARVATNPDAGSEQLDSLRIGLRALPADAEAAAVLPVDIPEADAVRAVVDAFRATGAPVVVPARQGRHGHPVLFARAAWPELLDVDLPDGARTAVHAHAHDRVEVPVSALPDDVDTPDDLRRLRERTGA
jgi:CTP:molybdopterin cytidylyltransferase MocA